MNITPDLMARFFNRVDASGGRDACWPWQGYCHVRTGHGQMSVDGKLEYTHRLAWLIEYGEIPSGQVVRHTCDNPPCCNDKHLELGTQLENVRDQIDRGRRDYARRKTWIQKARESRLAATASR